jgi:polar amino acid transport system substrate-binding protein
MYSMLGTKVGAGWLTRAFAMLAAVAAVAGYPQSERAHAQTCGKEYTIKDNETLAQIAARVYGNPTQWTVIFYANQDRLGGNMSLLVPGLSIRLPCIGGQQPAPAAQTTAPPAPVQPAEPPKFIISSLLRRVEFLTADGFAPYTGRSLEGGGMLTQVIDASMALVKEESKGRFDYGISWVNDWAAHLNPLLLTRAFDVGFPWARPDCDAPNLDQSSQFRCQRFFFSDPLYEVITGLFVRTNSRVKSLRREEITGMTMCRPAGYPVHELDKDGRNWVKDGLVTLMRPPSVDECFRLLGNGSVDGVVEAELAGRASIASLGLTGKVRMIDQPVALTTYHALISKSHPQARTILYYINSSLERLRESGEYDRIIERHLNRFWESQTTPNAAIGNTPAVSKSPPRPQGESTPSALASGDPKAKLDPSKKAGH